MNKTGIAVSIAVAFMLISCTRKDNPAELLRLAISAIDAIGTISYRQEMIRTNPANSKETIVRYREMYFKRMIEDSIVGVKGHWDFYDEDRNKIIYEDIYDGARLIRKNNRDSTATVFDLLNYPEFRESHFWSHNTPFSMQYLFRYIMENSGYYQLQRLNDTIVQDVYCFQVRIRLENKASALPGFAYALEDSQGNVSTMIICMDALTHIPVRMRSWDFSVENPEEISFIDQTYYDVQVNIRLDEKALFNTSVDSLAGYRVMERKP